MDNKVLYPETIKAQDLPAVGETTNQVSNPSSLNTTGGKEYAPANVKANQLPQRIIAHDIMSPTLNTQSKQILDRFNFGKMGAIQIGDFESGNGEGDIKISPAGIVARGTDGQTTFAINAKTGDATFKGDIVGGTISIGSGMFTVDAAGNVIANSLYLTSSFSESSESQSTISAPNTTMIELLVELELSQILLVTFTSTSDYLERLKFYDNDTVLEDYGSVTQGLHSSTLIIRANAGSHTFKLKGSMSSPYTASSYFNKISAITLGRY